MARQPIRDESGHTLGWLDDTDNDHVAYDYSGKRLGRYDERADKTYDRQGRLISSSGDVLTSLFDSIFRKKK
jgi:hypothetical protein